MAEDNQLAKAPDNKPADYTAGLLVNFIQTVTGFAASDKKDLVRDISHLVQRGIQGHLARGLVEEYNALKERGKIKEDYETTDQCRQQTSYVFDAIKGDGAIDEKRFRAMKNIFINSAEEKLSNRTETLPVELMSICGTLNGGEVVVLEAAYRLSKKENKVLEYAANDASSWIRLIAKESGFGIEGLVAKHETTLLEKGLLGPRTAGGNIVASTNYHLSDLGLKLCQFIQDYNLKEA